MKALMFFWVVNVFYLSLGRNVLFSSLLLRVLWLMSARCFKRISALHLLLQSCSCFSKNRSSKTDSGVPSQLLQFIMTVVMRADIKSSHLTVPVYLCGCKHCDLYYSLGAGTTIQSWASNLGDHNYEMWHLDVGCLYISSSVVGAAWNNWDLQKMWRVCSLQDMFL